MTRRASSAVVAETVRRLALPVTTSTRSLVHSALATALDNAVKKERGLEPLVLTLEPFPVTWLMSLDGFDRMSRSADGSSLLIIFCNDADVRPHARTPTCLPARPHARPPVRLTA